MVLPGIVQVEEDRRAALFPPNLLFGDGSIFEIKADTITKVRNDDHPILKPQLELFDGLQGEAAFLGQVGQHPGILKKIPVALFDEREVDCSCRRRARFEWSEM